MRTRLKQFRELQVFWPLIIFFGILATGGLITGGSFFKMSIVDGHLFGRLIDIIRNGSKLMLLSIGMTMVLATGGTDISVGSVMAISGAIACSIIDSRILTWLNGNVAAAITLALISGVICGLWNGILVSRMKLQPIVATMILLVAGRGIAQLITKGKIVTINSPAYYFINGGYVLGLPFPIYLVAAALILALVFTKRTSFGLFLESTGYNPEASRFAGIKVANIKLLSYVISGFMAAMAGLIESAGIKGADCNNAGQFIELDAILAVAIGGTILSGGKHSIPASIIGALVIQSITTLVLTKEVAPQVTQVVKALIVIAICLFQSKEFKDAVLSKFRVEKAVQKI